MTMRYEPPDLTGTAITWGDEEPAFHGVGDLREVVYPGRRVAIVPGRIWPCTPETCDMPEYHPGVPDRLRTEWLAGGRLLVCLGCGLDST